MNNNEIRNIDDLDPDHNYISGLRPKEPERETKDSILGNGDCKKRKPIHNNSRLWASSGLNSKV